MVDFCFRRKIFTIREMSFGTIEETKKSGCDVVYMHSNDIEPIETRNTECYVQRQYTLVNDLLLPEDELLSGIGKNYRYEIRRAEREQCTASIYTSADLSGKADVIDDFKHVYNEMFQKKGMGGYSFNSALINAGIESGNVVVSTCSFPENAELRVYHAYLCDGNSAMLVYSASPLWADGDKEKTNQIGRMNKLLHWEDIKWFKNKGYNSYEWGGIHSPDEPNGIDKFKMEFGGTVCRFNNYVVARSLLGRVYTYLVWRKERG